MDYNYWITINKELIKISDMTSEHIKNCIYMIERSKFYNGRDMYEELAEPPIPYTVDYELYKPYLNIFKEELKKR